MRKYYRNFSRGQSNADPDMIPEGAVVSAKNYEYREKGVLSLRKDPTTSNVQTGIGTFSMSPLKFWVWYPRSLPEDATTNIMYVIYDSDYKLYLLYETATGWTRQRASSYTYSADTNLQIFAGSIKFLIADNTNICHFVTIDSDGEILYGDLKLPPPPEAPVLRPMEGWDENYFETDETADRVGTCGLVQAVCTVVTEYDEESNPSAVSNTLDLQYFKIDSDNLDERWIDRIFTNNLTIPELDNYTQAKLKHWNIYYRLFRYSDLSAEPFTLGATVEISDKTSTAKGTHTLTNEIGLGDTPDYENDSAPIAKSICESGNVIFFAGVKTRMNFPHEFSYCKINVQNPDSKSYVDGVVYLRLYDSHITNSEIAGNKKIQPDFDWSQWFNDFNQIRMYGSDLITPLSVVRFNYNVANHYLDILVRLPLFEGGVNNPIYFCYGNEVLTNEDGGEFCLLTNYYANPGWDKQKTFTNKMIKSNSVLCCPIDKELKSDECTNKSNTNNSGEMIGDISINTGSTITRLFDINKSSGVTTVMPYNKFLSTPESIASAYNCGAKFSKFNMPDLPATGGYINGWVYLGQVNVASEPGDGLLHFYFSSPSDSKILSINSNHNWNFCEREWLFTEIKENGYYHITISWVNDEKVSLFIYGKTEDGYNFDYEEIDTEVFRYNNFEYIALGRMGGQAKTYAKYQNWEMVTGRYLSAENNDDINAVRNMANLMPAFETPVGRNWQTDEYNQNVTFSETNLNELKFRRNTYKWTELNGLNSPDLFEKMVREPLLRVIPVQSQLDTEYIPTVLFFTQNTLTRFIVSGEPVNWRAQTDNMIEEFSDDGLFAINSLTRYKERLFWYDGGNINMWKGQYPIDISTDKIDIEPLTDYIGFITKEVQYIMHSPSTGVGYVYDILGDAFTHFDSMNIIHAQTMKSSGSGVSNLLLDSNGVVKQYPGTVDTVDESEIETGQYNYDNVVFDQFRMDFEGNINVTVTVTNGTVERTDTFTNISVMKFYTLLRGLYGDKIKFDITGVTKFKRIDIDTIQR